MNLTALEARALIAALRAELDHDAASLARDREVMVAPAFPAIPAASQALAGSSIDLGAQNVHFEDKGAFTGQVSPPMLKAFGVRWVIVGHSECRHIFGESDELIGKKIAAAIRHNLNPILCVGETLEHRDAGKTSEIVLAQLIAGLKAVEPERLARVTVAYEPVWAIGTGRNATPEQAQEVHAALRSELRKLGGAPAAESIRILYGGSVTADNIDSIASKPDIDGALVGGASLKTESFSRIVRARVS